MKDIVSRLGMAALALLFSGSLYADPPANMSGWTMVFNDEFDGNSLDKSKWNPTYNWGHTHNHRAYCVEENVSVSDGLLRIKGEAKRHPQAPATCKSGDKTYSLDYTSGAIDTRGKFEVKYGYIEGRFKMPKQLGTWPAFWTLQDGWPPEIDIFEVPHARNQHHYYLHYTKTDWYASHGSAWDHEASFGGVHTGPDKSADFHTYGLEWNDQYLSFYFDDQLVASYNKPSEISQLAKNYIIINLAIGGWATDNGNPIEVTSGNPAYLECDWVRVWSKNSATDLPQGKVRFYSMETGECLQANGNDIVLGDCSSSASLATIAESGSAYRINFGNKVLEIPNETKEAGVAVGLWEWNGKAHQQLGLSKEKDYPGLVVSMRFTHSGYYVLTDKGDVVQNTRSGDRPLASLWRIYEEGEEIVTSVEKTADTDAPLSLWYADGLLYFVRNGCSGDLSYSVYDIRGVMVNHGIVNEGAEILPLDLRSGVYVVKVEVGGASADYRLVVK